MNQNSLDAYYRAKDSGLISRRRLEAFKCFCENGPMSARQVVEKLGWTLDNKGRITELHQQNLIAPTGIQQTPSGNSESVYTITNNAPVKLPKTTLTSKDKALKAIEKLSKDVNETDCDELRRIWTVINRMGL
jgi:hypothetical protein